MCRIAAYLGPPLPLSALLLDPPHSLEHQSRNAREMSGGSVAGDGWGVSWFPESEDAEPGLLKSILPLWADENAKSVAHSIRSGCMVGHVRLASDGSEICFLNTPIYLFGKSIFTINGELKPWPGEFSRRLQSQLADEQETALKSSTDGEMIGALWYTCLREKSSADAGTALTAALQKIRTTAKKLGGTWKTNIILADRSSLVAVRHAEPEEPNSLYYLTGEERWRGGTVIASEPLDDGPGWQHVEPATLLRVDSRGLCVEAL